MARKGWTALSPQYRSRLEKAGISRADYERGQSLQSARGHKSTPEHAHHYDPQKYPQYHQERLKLERQLYERKRQIWQDSPKWRGRSARDAIREKRVSLQELRWAIAADDSELMDALSSEPETYKWLYYH